MEKRRFPFILLILLLLILPVRAADEAHSVNGSCDMRIYGERADTLLDGNLRSHSKVHYGTEITVSSNELIGGLYLEFSQHPGAWTLLCGEKTVSCGADGFLHEYIRDLNCYSLTLHFSGEGILANVYVLSPGERPDWVQDWQKSWDKADVLLLPTHSDDDTLFFGGVVPWCLDKGARVQVAYLINHSTELYRCNELLNGLWVSGLRNYPVLGEYEDTGPDGAMPVAIYERKGVTYEDMLTRQVRLYRQFKPQVVICHDQNGEYGHGAHKLYWKLATEAIEHSGDSGFDGDSAARYGVWIPSKVYAHLQQERSVIIDLDEPLRSFGYKTGYELAQKAFACHESQYDYFAWYFWGAPTASRLQQYSSREYGLFYSAVGDDFSGRSFFDNLTLYNTPAEPESAESEAPGKTEEPAPQATAAPAAPESAETDNGRLEEIRKEQQRLKLSIGCLCLVVLLLCVVLKKLRNKERGFES